MGNTHAQNNKKSDAQGPPQTGSESKIAQQSIDYDEKEYKAKMDGVVLTPHFILFGDSVLDNKAWLTDKEHNRDVEKLMNIELSIYNAAWKCKNLAVDGNTTQSLILSLEFCHLASDKQHQPKRFQSLQYYLESEHLDVEKETPIVMLSVGGNDVLGSMYDIKQTSKKVLQTMQQNAFLKSYEQIVSTLRNECKCEVIIVFTYEPHIRFCAQHNIDRKELLKIIEWAAQHIFAIARKHQLPVIDLNRTCNPFNAKHYASGSPIEPNEVNGGFTTKLAMTVLYDFDWSNAQNRTSKIYFGQHDDGGGIHIQPNTQDVGKNYYKLKLQVHPSQKQKK